MGVNGISGPSNIYPPSAPSGASVMQIDGELLPHPIGVALAGDVGAELAKLSLEGAQDQRKMAKETRKVEERAQEAADAAQISALRDKADEACLAGCIGGLTTIGSGAIAVAGAGPTENAKTDAIAKATGLRYEGSAKLLEGAGKLTSTGFQRDADESGTRATEAEQSSGRHKRAVDDARDQVEAANKEIDRAIDFYKEYSASKSDEAKATLLRA